MTGLSGTGLVLEVNGGQTLSVAANGAITFPTPLADGSSYVVTVQTQPTAYREICGVSNGSGTVSGADVTNVAISCSTVVGFLYDVDGNQIVSYGISPGTGALVPFGVPVAPPDVPAGTAIQRGAMTTSPGGAFLYVSNTVSTGNAIDPNVSGTISIYAVNKGSGALTPTGSLILPGTMRPWGAMSMSSSGFLFVLGAVVQGAPPNPESWTLTTYSVDAGTGALTPAGTALNFATEVSFATTADGKRLYVLAGDLNRNDAPSPVTVTLYAIDSETGTLTAGATLNLTSSWSGNYLSSVMAVDPLGRYLYMESYSIIDPVMDTTSASVQTYAIDSATGALTTLATGTPVNSGAALAADPSGRYLYMVVGYNWTPESQGVMALAIDQSSGSVTPIGSLLLVSGQPAGILCDPTGRFLYVANDGSALPTGASSWDDLAAFNISADAATAGQLEPSGVGTLEPPSNGQPSLASSASPVVVE